MERTEQITMSTPQPARPTADFVQKYIDRTKQNPQYAREHDDLAELLRKYPKNRNLDEVKIKVEKINRIYATRISNKGLVRVAKHIVQINIDPQLDSNSPEVVENIALVKNHNRREYSFATKYCSWHKPNAYPRLDNFVKRLLWDYQKSYGFSEFDHFELVDYDRFRYVRFKEIVEAFRDFFCLNQFNFNDLDQFLWAYGEEFYSRTKHANERQPRNLSPKERLTTETIFKGKRVTRDKIKAVIHEFDEQFRNSNSYDAWLGKGTYKYAIKYHGKLYPPKFILSRVTGMNISKFSGGIGTNRVFCQLAFDVAPK